MAAEIIPLQGFWRPNLNSTIFSDCAAAHQRSDKRCLAEFQCNDQTHTAVVCNATELDETKFADSQCTPGYSGVLCSSCDYKNGFVKTGNACISCPEGADIGLAITVVIAICIGIYFIMLFLLSRVRGSLQQRRVSKMQGPIKILIMYLQIISAMPSTMNSVDWPNGFINFTHFVFPLINLEFLALFDVASCRLALHPTQRFVVHMLVPIFLIFTLFLAFQTSMLVFRMTVKHTKKKKSPTRLKRTVSAMSMADKETEHVLASSVDDILRTRKHLRFEYTIKMVILSVLLLYPGLGTRIFSMLRCSEVDGMEEGQTFFQQDLDMKCFQDEHMSFTMLSVAGIVVYVVGVPAIILGILVYNRKHLHDESSPKHADVKYAIGGIYLQYEPEFWWFELIIISTKMLMTGALGVVEPGSPIQIALAVVVMLTYNMLVLKLSPYQANGDDVMSFISGLGTVIITFIGLLLKLDVNSTPQNFDIAIVDTILLFVSMTVIVISLLNLFRIWISNYPGCKKNVESVSKKSKTKVGVIEVVPKGVDTNRMEFLSKIGSGEQKEIAFDPTKKQTEKKKEDGEGRAKRRRSVNQHSINHI